MSSARAKAGKIRWPVTWSGARPSRRSREDRRWRRVVVRELVAWATNDDVLDILYGPRRSELEIRNQVRACLGLGPLTRADIPPGKNWDTIQPRRLLTEQQRKASLAEKLGITLPPDSLAAPPDPEAEPIPPA